MVLSVHRKNSTLKPTARFGEIARFAVSKIEMKSQRATVEMSRARPLEKEIIQTRGARLDKISASAQENATGGGAIAEPQ
ncbi:hypothetical protein [uncultured Rikenella sp.]|uniref:hypothetical protein n=1 Tax=uncultured Rikenella sp. TaxID=368003 RepID=UPI0026102ED3|nr:hypothetical protein [uncultured Rikenella sp.]